jgi:hypothetical protein
LAGISYVIRRGEVLAPRWQSDPDLDYGKPGGFIFNGDKKASGEKNQMGNYVCQGFP